MLFDGIACVAFSGGLPIATVEDVVHLAKGLLRRVHERLPVQMQS